MPTVTFDHVRKNFGDTVVVEDFDLEVADGELVVLVGGSGSGKSTILRMLAGLESVTAGTIRIAGRDVTALPPRERDVAMVFQDYALYPHMTVRENLSLGLRLRSVPRQDIDRRIGWAAGILGLDALLERKPKALSGGQRQRVAMGRAMVREPMVFLFDEPLSNLDAGLRAQMRIEIGSLQRRLKTTTVYVTHDQVEAMTLGDRIVVLAGGRIQQIGVPIELYEKPVNRFVAGFIGTPPMNFIEGRLEAEDGSHVFVADGMRVRLGARPNGAEALLLAGSVDHLTGMSGPVTLGVRPEDLLPAMTTAGAAPIDAARLHKASPSGEELAGIVRLVERLGGTSHIHFDVGSHRLIAAVSSQALPATGERVTFTFSPPRLHLFDQTGAALR